MLLKISSEQLDGLAERAGQQFDRTAGAALLDAYSDHFKHFGGDADATTLLAGRLRDTCGAWGINGQQDVYRLLLAAISLGAGFLTDPRFRRTATRLRTDTRISGGARVSVFMGFVDDWLSDVWNGVAMPAIAQNLSRLPHSAATDDEVVQLTHSILPGHWQALEDSEAHDFLIHTRRLCEELGGLNPVPITALAILHGPGFMGDPTLPNLVHLVRSNATERDFAERLGGFYGELA